MAINNPSEETYGFLLIPNFSMLSFASTLEPLRMANRASGQLLYQWRLYSATDRPVAASNGLLIPNTHTLTDTAGLDTLIVVAGIVVAGIGDVDDDADAISRWLKKLARNRVTLGAVSTGTGILARAGLLKGRRCTIHWENRESLKESFSDIQVSSEIYEVDKDRVTCSGGVAGLDMMLQLIAEKHGLDLAKDVAEQSVHPVIRPAKDKQRMALPLRYKTHHPRLLKAIELMQTNLEHTKTCAQISNKVGISARQLTRLFKQHLGISPSEHYLDLRLEKAHHLLQQSSLTILQLSTACGFMHAPHFARCYRRKYGVSPKQTRKLQLES
jgi:transcriptional regulator GlxA family with amidase domain